MEKKKEENCKPCKVTERMRENPWIVSSLVLGILVIILVVGSFGGMTGKIISEKDAGEKVVDWVFQQTGAQVDLIGSETFDSMLYEVTVNYQGNEIPLYVTRNGNYLIQGLTSLEIAEKETETTSQEIPKSDKPVVELFVMTHCPYGTQAEKGLLPTIGTLGDAIDAKIRFVHYFMHDPEEAETPVQVCLREEQSEKYYNYLICFLEDGDSERCIGEAGVDASALNDCISSGRADEYYAEDSALSEGYGVQGSPTLVINGQIVSSGRDSASFLDVICQAFSDVPEICGTELSSQAPSPGFGWSGTASSSTSAQC